MKATGEKVNMRVPLRQFGKADEGQSLELTAMVLVVLMMMAGLGADVGFLRYTHQRMQKAADAAAIAGASAFIYGGSYTAAAQNDAAANGFTNGNNGVTVTVNNPPQHGPYTGNASYVEVIVAQALPGFFVTAGGFGSTSVSARAVANAAASASGCIYVLDPGGTSFPDSGSAALQSACGLLIDSTSATALNISGSASINASSIGIVGNWTESGSASVTPTPVTGIAAFSDPLAGVPAPTIGACTSQPGNYSGSQVATLTQGTFCGGINISGSAKVTFTAGTYILDGGGLNISGSATGVGTGVTFYDTHDSSHAYAPFNLSGSSGTSFSAPTTGSLAGILLFQDRSVAVGSSASSVSGSSGQIYTGALYFPTTGLSYSGSSDLSPYTIIVAYTFTLSGSATINDNYSSLPGGASPIHSSAMAE